MPATLPQVAPDELAALRAGDEDALAHVFASHYYTLASEVERELGETTGLARVVEGAFVRAWHEREKLDTPERFESFLHEAAHDGAVRERSRRAALHRLGSHTNASTESTGHAAPTTAPEAKDAWREVAAALKAPTTTDEQARRVRHDLSKHAVTGHLASVAKPRSLRYPLLLAGAFLAITVPAIVWLNGASRHAVATSALEKTDVRVVTAPAGQQGEVKLLDGSTVSLMNGSSIRIPKGFGGELRSVRVIGAAAVNAPHELVTPLDVRVGSAAVLATGASFDVTAEDGRDAFVRMRGGEALVRTDADSRTLGAGSTLAIAADGTMRVPTELEIREALGWADGRLVLTDRTLRETLPLMRRWYGLDIGVANESLFERRVTMDVSLSSSRAAIAGIEESAGVRFGYDGRLMILRDANAATR